MIEIIDTVNLDEVLQCYHKVENNIEWTEYGAKGRQAGLQYRTLEDPWNSAVGKSRGHELLYTSINPFFTGTVFEELINKYKLKRTRLLWLKPMACYSMHQDSTPRIHIPLITNPECYFVFKQGLIQHMPAGSVYSVNTTLFHSFMNCSDHERLHLVGAITNN
jgi:hypothetical protein